MASSNISSNLSSGIYSGLFSLNRATNRAAASTERLSSGNRLVRAGDDVAAMSISTGLRSRVSSLTQALSNATQADSFLQTAYSGLSNINDLLDSMTALATQANSGSLTATDLAHLQTSFDSYKDQIDSLAANTSFGNVTLLDGSISDANNVSTYDTAATQATGLITFTGAIAAASGLTVQINGVDLTEGVDFTGAATTTDTATAIANAINTSTNSRISQVSALAGGSGVTLTARAGGSLGNAITINKSASTATASFTVGGGSTANAGVFSLTGGTNSGLTSTSVSASGTIGDALVNTQSQTSGSTSFTLTGLPTANDTFTIDNGNGGSTTFTFKALAGASDEVTIGATADETLQNLVSTISQYTAGTDNRFILNQLDLVQNGTTLTIKNKNIGNPTELDGATAVSVSTALTGAVGTLTSATITGGTNTGVNASGVTNKDFIGTVSGFSATYNSADNLTASITVGSYTYQATISDTTPGVNTTTRFKSTTNGGGYFDVQLASAGGMAVANQANADTYASHLDAAFSGLSFSQTRFVSDFAATGNLTGASVEIKSDDFSTGTTVDNVTVTASPGGGVAPVIQLQVNGETFRSNSNLENNIAENQVIELTSSTSSNKVTIRMGNFSNDISDDTNAATFQSLLRSNFGVGTGNSSVSFQVGSSSSDTLDISIGSASSDSLFNGQTLDITSVADSAIALTALSTASNTILGMMTSVGALQERSQIISSNLSSSITEQEAARSALADTDVAAESISLALSIVQSQSAIAAIAQTQQLQTSLLDLINNN